MSGAQLVLFSSMTAPRIGRGYADPEMSPSPTALDYPCPECGAEPRKRCRKPVSLAWRDAKREQDIPAATRYQHVKPHLKRAQLAERAALDRG